MNKIFSILCTIVFCFATIGCNNCDKKCQCQDNGICCCEEGTCKIDCDCENCNCEDVSI